MLPAWISKKPVFVDDLDPTQSEVSCPAQAETQLFSADLRNGYYPYLIEVANNADAGSSPNLRWRIYQNDSKLNAPWGELVNEYGTIADPYRLPNPFPLQPGSTIKAKVQNNHASSAFNAVARLVVAYFNEPL